MNRTRTWILTALLVGMGGLALALIVWGDLLPLSDRAVDPADDLETVDEPAVVPVRVTELTETLVPQSASYTGSIEAWERAHVTAPSGQRIDRIHVREGDRVERGQVVADMDAINLRQAEVELRAAERERERMQRLVDIGSVARQQLEQAEDRYEAARSNVETLRRNTRLTAPIRGVVTARHFVDGEQFVPAADAPAIAILQQVDPVRVVINVSERLLPAVQAGMSATVRLDTYGDRTFDGTVDRINPVVQADSRTFRVEIRIDNPEGLLSPGMFARVSLDLGETTGLFLPRSALRTALEQVEPYVFVVEDDTARRTAVTTGERFEDRRQILSGLSESDRVVTEGASRLQDGTPVRILE